MTRLEKIRAAKLGDIIEKNYDDAGGGLAEPGKFTAFIEAHRACEIAEWGEHVMVHGTIDD